MRDVIGVETANAAAVEREYPDGKHPNGFRIETEDARSGLVAAPLLPISSVFSRVTVSRIGSTIAAGDSKIERVLGKPIDRIVLVGKDRPLEVR